MNIQNILLGWTRTHWSYWWTRYGRHARFKRKNRTHWWIWRSGNKGKSITLIKASYIIHLVPCLKYTNEHTISIQCLQHPKNVILTFYKNLMWSYKNYSSKKEREANYFMVNSNIIIQEEFEKLFAFTVIIEHFGSW